jgi:hypothetical protein
MTTPTLPDWRALCAELADAYLRLLEHVNNSTWLGYEPSDDPLILRARASLAQPGPAGPADEEIMELMPQQMHEDLAAAARALAEQAGTDNHSATGVMRIMLNRHAVDFARVVLQRWGR